MGNAFFVVWRESLEAFLVAGILYAWLGGDANPQRGRRALLLGMAAGVLLACGLGVALMRVQDELAGQRLEIFQIGILLLAAGLMVQMVFWMRRHGRGLRQQLQAEIGAAAARSGYFGVALVGALAVAREGAETVVFLYGLAQEGDFSALLLGALGGLLAAGLTAWGTAAGLARLNVGLLLRLSSWLLLLLASALWIDAVERLVGGGWLPALLDPVWDSAALLEDGMGAGKLVAAFTGYRARPALSVLLAFVAYWGLVGTAWRRSGRSHRHAHALR